MSFCKIDEILKSYNFSLEDDVEKNTSLLISEMKSGIERNGSSSLAMLKTYVSPILAYNKKEHFYNEKTIVIDLGGSNLRSGLVAFDGEGRVHISKQQLCKTFTKKTYDTASSFFANLAKNIEYLKGESLYIAFCFSYAIEFLKTGYARVKSLSKDLSVKDIEGRNVGEELKSALLEAGWEKEIKIFVLNDTMAILYSSLYNRNKNYSSYVSYILGTGLNAAYIERKNESSAGEVLILEAGAFDKLQLSDFDRKVINESKEGEYHILEKMCSSHYLGRITLKMLDALSLNGAFSRDFFLYLREEYERGGSNIWERFNNFLFQKELVEGMTEEEQKSLHYVLNLIIERDANLCASLIGACCIKNTYNNAKECPIAIAIEGSTILKTYQLYSKIEQKLKFDLTKKRNIYFEIITVENATFIGSAILSLSHR